MGVLPLVLTGSFSWEGLSLKGDEKVTIHGLDYPSPRQQLQAEIEFPDSSAKKIKPFILLRQSGYVGSSS
jgi:aconitate hydratase